MARVSWSHASGDRNLKSGVGTSLESSRGDLDCGSTQRGGDARRIFARRREPATWHAPLERLGAVRSEHSSGHNPSLRFAFLILGY